MELNKKMLEAEFKSLLFIADFKDDDFITTPFRKEFLSYALALIEENKTLHASCTELTRNLHECKTDTVRKMQAEIEARCIKGGIYPAFVKSTIDQIAEEMLNGT